MVGDKLVTLDGLKAVYQDLNGNIGDLKSATGNLTTYVEKQYFFDSSTNGNYVKTNGSKGSAVGSVAGGSSGANHHYMIIECSAGDVFDIDVAPTASNARAWCFADSSNNILLNVASGSYKGRIIAPEGTVKLIVNDNYSVKTGTVCKMSGNDVVADVIGRLSAIENAFKTEPQQISEDRWQQGTYDTTGTGSSSICCRTKTSEKAPYGAGMYRFVPKTGYEFRIVSGGAFITNFTTIPVTFVANATQVFRIVVRRHDQENLVPHGTSDIPTGTHEMDLDAVTYTYIGTDKTFTQSGKWADAKETGDRLTYLESLETDRILPLESLTHERLAPEPPSYYIDHLDSKIATIKEKMQAAGQNSFTFAFITDIHWGFNEKKSPSLMRYIMDRVPVNDVICGGDIIDEGEKAEMLDEVYDCINAFKLAGITFPVVIGNHDHNWNIAGGQREITPSRRFTDGEVWASMEAQYDKYQRVFWDGEFNFYIDYPESNTRVIVVDTGDTDANNDLQWDNYENFCKTLEASADKHIIVISHGLNVGNIGAKLTRLCYAFNNRVNFTENYSSQGVPYLTYDYNFSTISETKTGNVYAIIGGHNHTDSVYTVSGLDGQKPAGQEENNPYFPYITRTTDSKHVSQNAVIQPVPGTVTEQAFDIVTISYDVSTPKVSFVRIGRGDNLEYSPTIPDHS